MDLYWQERLQSNIVLNNKLYSKKIWQYNFDTNFLLIKDRILEIYIIFKSCAWNIIYLNRRLCLVQEVPKKLELNHMRVRHLWGSFFYVPGLNLLMNIPKITKERAPTFFVSHFFFFFKDLINCPSLRSLKKVEKIFIQYYHPAWNKEFCMWTLN